MNINEAVQAYQSGELSEAAINRSPDNRFHWFLILRDRQARHYILVDSDESVETYASIDAAANVAKHIGFKHVHVTL